MQQQSRLPLWFLLTNWALILAAFVLGAWLGQNRYGELPDPQRHALQLVYRAVLDSHVDPPDEHELLERAIAGMVDGLDEYSRYIPPAKVATYDERSSGHYEGIGAKITTHDEDVVVHFPFPDGPAEHAGLRPGDRILVIDGKPLASPEDRANFVELVRGPAGSDVTVRVARGDAQLDFTIQRGSVQLSCAKWAQFLDEDAGLAYVHLTDFFPTASAELFAAIEQLERERPLRGLILDLRYDGGGSLPQCLAIARAFIEDGIIATQHKPHEADEVYRADPAVCHWPDLPMVVLVNEHSASASEVLSGALQDHQRAAIVGMRTHGKGYVNTVYSWDGFDFKLKLTTGSYRTPSGRNIERNQATADNPADKENGGIVPDVEVAVDEATGVAIYQTLRRVLEVPAKYEQDYAEVARQHGFEIERGPDPATDPQLATALLTLRDRVKD